MVCCVIVERPHVEHFPYKKINTISMYCIMEQYWGHRLKIEAGKYKTNTF